MNLLHAFQLHPRITWNDLAVVLEVSPSSLSRKWKALTQARTAWLTYQLPTPLAGAGSHAVSALASLSAPAAETASLADQLQDSSRVLDAAITTGNANVFARIAGERMSELDLSGVLQTARGRSGATVALLPVRRDVFTASMWRLNALSAKQQEAIKLLRSERYPAGAAKRVAQKFSPEEQQILFLLAADPRVTASAVATQLGCSVSTASKSLRRVVASTLDSFRVDLSHEAFGWNYVVSTLLQAPPAEVSEVGAFLSRFPNLVRETSELVGRENLYFQAWAKSLGMIDEIDSLIQRRFPRVRTADRWITVRHLKLGGRRISEDGLLDAATPSASAAIELERS